MDNQNNTENLKPSETESVENTCLELTAEQEQERQLKVKKCKTAKLIVKIVTAIMVISACIVAKVFSGWWWAIGAFGIGIVFMFLANFVTELAVWYVSVRPYEAEKQTENVTEELENTTESQKENKTLATHADAEECENNDRRENQGNS